MNTTQFAVTSTAIVSLFLLYNRAAVRYLLMPLVIEPTAFYLGLMGLGLLGAWRKRNHAAIGSIIPIAIVFASCAQFSHAETIALYDAGTAGNPVIPPDPLSASGGSWTLFGVPGVTSAGPISDDSGLGLNAWNIVDNTTGVGHGYSITVTPNQISDALSNGWRLDARLRMVDDSSQSPPAHFLLFDDGSKRWSLLLNLDQNDDLVVITQESFPGGGGRSFQLTSDGSGSALYHDYSLVYSPSTGLASFFFDGALQTASYAGLRSINIFDAVFFGTGASLGQGSANYNFVQFAIVPEPSTGVCLLLGIGLVVMRLRFEMTDPRAA